jgi:hypothetical protein
VRCGISRKITLLNVLQLLWSRMVAIRFINLGDWRNASTWSVCMSGGSWSSGGGGGGGKGC